MTTNTPTTTTTPDCACAVCGAPLGYGSAFAPDYSDTLCSRGCALTQFVRMTLPRADRELISTRSCSIVFRNSSGAIAVRVTPGNNDEITEMGTIVGHDRRGYVAKAQYVTTCGVEYVDVEVNKQYAGLYLERFPLTRCEFVFE